MKLRDKGISDATLCANVLVETTGTTRDPLNQLSTRRFLTSSLASTIAAVMLVIFNATPTDAQPAFDSVSEEEAQFLIQSMSAAEQAEGLGQWSAASGIYLQMWEVLPIEEYRFRQGYCLEQAGLYPEALDVFEELASSERPEIVAAAEQRIAVLEGYLADLPGRLRVLTETLGALITVDEEMSEQAHAGEAEFEVSPGDHMIVVQLDGYVTESEPITIEPGVEVTVEITLTPVAPPDEPHVVVPETPEEPPGERDLLWPIVLGSVAVAAAGTGIAFGVLANDAADEAWAYDTTQPGATDEAENLLNERSRDFAAVSNGSFVTAGAFAVGAVLVFVFTGNSDSGTIDAPVGIDTDGETIGAHISWDF